VLANSDAGYKNHQDLPTDSPDEPLYLPNMERIGIHMTRRANALYVFFFNGTG
jgi:hypothetical protein